MSQIEANKTESDNDVNLAEKLACSYESLKQEIGKSVIGQKKVIEELIITLLAGGHCLLVGVPGLAKTLMVRSLAETLNLKFNRIQFTPDLMPSDITGTEVIQQSAETGEREFKFLAGPIFSNVILADEINRTPPKTQAALLEAMQEHQVTVGGVQHSLSDVFFILATQNPIEQEGTYPLPEAQLDRFMFQILIDYPDEEEEFEMIRQTTSNHHPEINSVLSFQEVKELQELVRRVPIADHVIQYALHLSRLTRPGMNDTPKFINDYIKWGAGPRAGQQIVLGAKARAILQGRTFVGIEDIQAVALPALRHRIMLNFNAEAEGITPDSIINQLIETASEYPGSKQNERGKNSKLFKS